jgi:hypothetical protein
MKKETIQKVINFVITTLVADSDAVGVVVAGVSALFGFWTAGIDHAILRNVIVVTDGVETTGLVAGF